jgi:class 3 adenylate cyclase
MNLTRFERAVWWLRSTLFLLLGVLVVWPPAWAPGGDAGALLTAGFWCVLARRVRQPWAVVLEAVVAGFILWLGQAPAQVAAAALVTFSVSHVALYGHRAATSVFVLLLMSLPLLGVGSFPEWISIGSGLLLVLGTSAVAGLAFRRQQSVRARIQRLANRAERMSFYLPDLLRRRLRHEPLPPCQLERAWLVLVFIDQVEFTRYSQLVGLELIEQRVQAFVREVRLLARLHGGVVMKLLGDGALLAFPAHSETEQMEACQRAWALARDALAAHQEPGVSELRVGIASGECSLGDWGTDDLLDFTVIGPAVNLAARLQSSAEVGGGLMCAVTAQRLDWLANPRCLELRGLGPTTAYAVP